MSYRHELWRELTAVGIRGRLRDRILVEIEDHLVCDPAADLGVPRELACRFADELGTVRVRRASRSAFASLSLAGVLFAVVFLTSPSAAFGALAPGTPWPGRLANIVGILAPQIALAAGVLAALRAWRRRRAVVIAAAEAKVILRRAAVGVAAGLASTASLGLLALEIEHHAPGWWVTLAEVVGGVGLVALASVIPTLVSARRVQPLAPGAAGDLFADLGGWTPALLRGRPWRFALIFAGLLAVAMAAFGVLADDGYDGALRGIAEALACLLGFATLGRYLSLWGAQGESRPEPAN